MYSGSELLFDGFVRESSFSCDTMIIDNRYTLFIITGEDITLHNIDRFPPGGKGIAR